MNDIDFQNEKMRIRISFAAQAKPVPVAGFAHFKENYAKSAPTMTQYRKPRLVQSSRGWYIEYYYRVPFESMHFYGNKKWKRFKVTEDMNRRKGKDREDYADWLITEINDSLKSGFTPFQTSAEFIEQQKANLEIPTVVDADKALRMFLHTWDKRGLEPHTVGKYKTHINRLSEWLHKNKMLHGDIKNITSTHIEKFLSDLKDEFKFSNRQYNNTFDFIRTCFKFLVKKKIIPESPCADIDKLKTKSSKHRFYDTKNLNDITKALLASDTYTYLAAQTVYYLCIRSDKELMNFKVGNIQWDQNIILLDAEGAKGNSARYVPMDDNIKALFIDHGINKYPGDYYVFGIKGKPSSKPFGPGFFAKRFRKVRDAAELDPAFTLYGFKHTRVIHLKSDNVSDADIMSLTGHRDFTSYAKYLRDLGMSADIKKINEKSRKI